MIFYVPGGKYELMLPPPTPPGQPVVTGVPNLVTVWRHLRLHPRGYRSSDLSPAGVVL